ncbi:MAG: hypothetical protein WC959_01165 [Kiritimatiellales bacterium]
MRCSISSTVLLIAVIAGAVFSETNDLDAAFAAQKKKKTVRVYSERAVLHDLSAELPAEASTLEDELDRKLRAKEAKEDSRIANEPYKRPFFPQPEFSQEQLQQLQEQRRNWLTFSDTNRVQSTSQNHHSDRIAEELQRQNLMREQQRRMAESVAAATNVSPYAVPAPGSNPPSEYESPLQRYQVGTPAQRQTQNYALPGTRSYPNAAPAAQYNNNAIPGVRSTVTLPGQRRTTAGVPQTPAVRRPAAPGVRTPLSPIQTDSDDLVPAPATTLDQLRKSAADRNADPFANPYR